MILNIITVGAVLLLAYAWSRWGAFSGLLHLLCTLVAGAIAFAVWEPLALAMISAAPTGGFFAFVESVAWAAALLGPFGLMLIVLRSALDIAVPGNLKNPGLVDTIGGAGLGAVAAYLAVGVMVIGGGYLRMNGVLGYQPVGWHQQGSVERKGSLWIQADRVAAMVFSQISKTSLASGEPLAKWYPDLDVSGYSLQLSHGDGNSRNALKPEDFKVLGGYEVGGASGSPMRDLLAFDDGAGAQNVVSLDGEALTTGRLVGYLVEFGPGAKEKFGQVTLTNGQARLIAERTDAPGTTITLHPHAIISQARPEDAAGLQRWRLIAAKDVIASVGGAATSNMGIEFAVPTGHKPIALVVKNVRARVDEVALDAFTAPSDLRVAIATGRLGGGSTKVGDLDRAQAEALAPNPDARPTDGSVISASNSLGFAFQKTNKQQLELSQDKDNKIITGTASWFAKEIRGGGNANAVPRELRVDRFEVSGDRVMVQVNVSAESPASLLGKVARTAESVLPPQLIDSAGTPYQAVGYIYEDKEKIEVRFDAGDPIRGLTQLPQLSAARSDQSLRLIFLVSFGVEIQSYALGNKVVLDFNPPLKMDQRQR